MQLISFLKRENNVKFPKFKYLMWTKIRPITPSRLSGSAQRLVVRVPHQAILQQQYWCSWFIGCDLQVLWWCFKGGIAGVPWVVAQNVSFELWLGIGVKAGGIPWVVARNNISWVVARDGRWTRETLELWLRLVSVAGVSVLVVASTDGSR